MAVPKKRTGKSAQAKRRANWKANIPATTKCTKCGAVILTHAVCPECGFYKGKAVSIKNPDYKSGEETKTETKKTRKTVKKAPVEITEKVETKTEETAKTAAEEVKAEENKTEE